MIINDTINDYISTSYTSSTAQGGGGSFKIGNYIYILWPLIPLQVFDIIYSTISIISISTYLITDMFFSKFHFKFFQQPELLQVFHDFFAPRGPPTPCVSNIICSGFISAPFKTSEMLGQLDGVGCLVGWLAGGWLVFVCCCCFACLSCWLVRTKARLL